MYNSWEDEDVLGVVYSRQLMDLQKDYDKLLTDYNELQEKYIEIKNKYEQFLVIRNPEDAYREDFGGEIII